MGFLNEVILVIGQFLKNWYAAQVTVGVVGLIITVVGKISGHWWNVIFGIILIAWAILLTINEYKQKPKA
jgi:energy-coupling factor transporter transmembrane protein EcfT